MTGALGVGFDSLALTGSRKGVKNRLDHLLSPLNRIRWPENIP
jgi:hypothetical protein